MMLAGSLCSCTPSYRLCIQAAVVQEIPAFFAPPDVAFSQAPPAVRLWSLHPTDVPSVTSYSDAEKDIFGLNRAVNVYKQQ